MQRVFQQFPAWQIIKHMKTHRIKSFVQGLEKLVLSMQGEKYTGIIIANGTSQAQLRELRKGYETVYTQLSAFASTQVNCTSNQSFQYSVAATRGNSYTETRNYSATTSETEANVLSLSHSESRESVAGKTIRGVESAASLLGAALVPITDGKSLVTGGVISGGFGMLSSMLEGVRIQSHTVDRSVRDFQGLRVPATERLLIMGFQRHREIRKGCLRECPLHFMIKPLKICWKGSTSN